jgi:hypothetical protein
MALAEDVARWARHEGRCGQASAGGSGPGGKSLAVILSFDMQTDVRARRSPGWEVWVDVGCG